MAVAMLSPYPKALASSSLRRQEAIDHRVLDRRRRYRLRDARVPCLADKAVGFLAAVQQRVRNMFLDCFLKQGQHNI
jgi:hypothetical protein